jgi:predicted RNA-binding Zn-ribbon protein involved in translation (DUF1610 family)
MTQFRLVTSQQHYCIPCDAWTDHEQEVTLPEQYRCGDPDYEDRTKCGRCGETYQCQECGSPLNIDAEECEDVLDHGYHGPETELFQVIADGTPWMDPDGHFSWARRDADSLADHVESLGYTVEVRPA